MVPEIAMGVPITDISITNVRTLAGEQCAALSKLTLLVGENSIGKSTFLGSLNALGRLAGLHELTDGTNYFDQEPFNMGNFDSVVRAGCTSFRIAIGLGIGPFRRFAIEFEQDGSATSFKETKLEIQLSSVTADPSQTLTIVRDASEHRPEGWRFSGPAFQFHMNRSEVSDMQFTTWLSRSIARGILPFLGDGTIFRKRADNPTSHDLATFAKFVNFFRHDFRVPETPLRIISPRPYKLKRQRRYPYNPIKTFGNHMGLETINDIGRQLDLFNLIDIRQHSNDEFEVVVDVHGSYHNLCDVGYGIVSLLPLITYIGSSSRDTLFLLQQPEVHVHPSAQAALIKMMAGSKHAFIVETHSDHIITWLRILVKEERLTPTDVTIIYFDQCPEDNTATRLHQIAFDRRANLSGQPNDYREFFEMEAARLLGFST